MTKIIFDENWINTASVSVDLTSWADDVITTLDSTGVVYLEALRAWFDKFPGSLKRKMKLAASLESANTTDHLGAVNELVWWAYLQYEQFEVKSLAVEKSSTPDFHIIAPFEFFVEVTTLNISKYDLTRLTSKSIALNHSETIRRVINKFTEEKKKQINYAFERERPCALVLFDYTTWSAYATQFHRLLESYLLGDDRGFQLLPTELSAIVYIERKVLDGRIGISKKRSAVYYNPYAKYSLPVGIFPAITQCRNLNNSH